MQTSSRQTYIDWLRILAIVAVLFFHSAMPFSDETWHIKNTEHSSVLEELIIWLHRFRMPLLFFISGTVSWYMLQKKSAGSFVSLRVRRLLIPLLFGMLVIVPPQVYLERVNAGYTGSFWSFYPSIFTSGAYPSGNLSWHHLWFILYLLVYDLLFAPLFQWLISGKGRALVSRLGWLGRGRRLYLIAVPSILIYATFAFRYPQTADLIHDYAFLPYWACYLLAGFFCIANASLMDSIQRNRRFSLGIALLTTLALNGVRWNGGFPESDGFYYLLRCGTVCCGWAWVLTAVGYGKQYLNRRLPVLDYLNQASYPFYILHQTVIVWLAFHVVRFSDNVFFKYGFIVFMTAAISMVCFHLFIRPFPAMRLLFGMQPRKKEVAHPGPTKLPTAPGHPGQPAPAGTVVLMHDELILS